MMFWISRQILKLIHHPKVMISVTKMIDDFKMLQDIIVLYLLVIIMKIKR